MTSHNPEPAVIAALYKFVSLPDYQERRDPLLELCRRERVTGTLLLAEEGFNGTIGGPRHGIDAVLAHLREFPGCADLQWKEAETLRKPFKRMKVRLKREIVTMGVPGIDPNKTVGTYVEPKDWNALISDPDTIVIDTRNDYEVAIGTFERAIDPKTKSFGQFPDWVNQNLSANAKPKVAMFCTGGIRCEKATALLKEQGFDEVYHLKGGILKYLEEVPPEESLWQGECFVFDERVSVGHGLKPGPYQFCSLCRGPFMSGRGEGGYADIFCDDCEKNASQDRKDVAMARQRQIEIAKARGYYHMGDKTQRR